MKLRTKLQIAAAVTLFLFVAGTNVSIYYLYENTSTASEVDRLMSQSESLAGLIGAGVENELPMDEVISEGYVPANGMVRIINENDETIQTITRDQRFTQQPASFSISANQQTLITDEGERFAFVSQPIIWEDGQIVTLEVSEQLIGLEENMAILRYILFAASLLVLVPAIIGGWLLGSIILRPVNSLIEKMSTIQEKGSLQTIENRQQSKDELQQLINVFNEMIERLKVQFEKQDQFVSDASHELRTPLTVIDGYATMLERWGKTQPEVLDEALAAISAESAHMKHLAEQLLLLVKDEDHLRLNQENIDLAEVTYQAVKAMRMTTEKEIEFAPPEHSLPAWLDVEMVKQVLYILIDNALKYSNDKVVVDMVKMSQQVMISVTDYGPGISQEDQQRIFDRFYRINKARSRQDGGTGLGLAIASKLMDIQGGRISVDSELNQYTTFTIMFPAKG